MAIAKQFEFFINGRGLLTDPTQPLKQSNLSHVLDTFHVNGRAFQLSLLSSGLKNALTAAVQAATVVAANVPSSSAVPSNGKAKQFEFQFDGRGVLTDATKALDTSNVTFILDIVSINGVSYKLSTFTAPQLKAITDAMLAAATVTNSIAAPAQSHVSAAVKVAGGSGYAVNDTITLANGVVLTVATIATGAVATVTISNAGSVNTSSIPANPAAQVSTSGAGTGATFNLTWIAS
jgi:hypothetical protein